MTATPTAVTRQRDREMTALAEAGAAAALTDPAAMALFLDGSFVLRPHLALIAHELAKIATGETRRLMLKVPPQTGKPVKYGSMILMGDGSRKPIEHIQPGEEVITHRGRPRRVTAVHDQGQLPVVEITTANGRRTVAAHDHPFLTTDGWVNAADLTNQHFLATTPAPDCAATGKLEPEAARLLGYFIGDGCTTRNGPTHAANIVTANHGVDEEIRKCAHVLGFNVSLSGAKHQPRKYREGEAWRLNISGGARTWLQYHGVAYSSSHTKRVPPEIFSAPPHVIAEFIGAYWDCDGTVTRKGRSRDGQWRQDVAIELYSVNLPLLHDVQHLLLRLGIRSAIREKKTSYKGNPHYSYRLSLGRTDDSARFRELVRLAHAERASRVNDADLLRTDFDAALAPDRVKSVTPAGVDECRCLTVDEDHTFTTDDLVVHNSTLAAVWTPLWLLARNPRNRVIIGSYGQNLAMRRGRAIRRMIDRHGWHWNLALEYGSRQTTDWTLESGGGIKSVGVGSGVTGTPADILILDDPHKGRAEADSLTKRDAVWDWWSADFLTRLAPGGPIIAILTPWHEDDWSHRALEQDGTVEEGGEWRVIRMPAFADTPDDPLGRPHGAPLSHPLIPEDDVDAVRAHWESRRNQTNARDWGALYQLDPKPAAGALVTRELLRRQMYVPPPASPVKTAVAVDPSGEGRDAAGVVGGYLGDDGKLYVTHDRTLNGGSEEWSHEAAMLAAEIDADFFVVETNGAFGGGAARLVLKSAWDALKTERPDDDRFQAFAPQIKAVHARKGKLLRAEPIAQQMSEDRVRFGDRLPELREEWATWQPTSPESPGRIDASSYLVYALLPVPGSEAVVTSPTGVAKSAPGTGGGARINRPRPGRR